MLLCFALISAFLVPLFAFISIATFCVLYLDDWLQTRIYSVLFGEVGGTAT